MALTYQDNLADVTCSFVEDEILYNAFSPERNHGRAGMTAYEMILAQE